MSVLSLLLNVAWIVCGGLEMALGWLVAAVITAITIVGIPWTKAAFNIAFYTLLPFGQKAVSRADYSGQHDVGTGPLAGAGRMVAGARPCDRSGFSCRDHYRNPICLGASQARRHRTLADWQDDHSGGWGCISLRSAKLIPSIRRRPPPRRRTTISAAPTAPDDDAPHPNWYSI